MVIAMSTRVSAKQFYGMGMGDVHAALGVWFTTSYWQ